mmetsp:Transcript_84531/g.272477  ORF Transcript_84531/g.272477 Transcript_84531/m.272477 type:complete len:193 (+) Transcript_84531:117-695(+)
MSYTLYYHSECKTFYGRGWAPLAMLKHTGKDFEVKGVEAAPADAGFACPFMTLPGGYSIAQTSTIIEVVGAQCGLAPGNEAEDAKAKQLVSDAADLFGELSTKPDQRLMKWLTYLESNIKDNGYFCSSGLSYADFGVYMTIGVIALKKAVGKLDGVELPPKLEKWYSVTMAAIPAVKEMTDSGIPILPPSMV